MMRQRSLSEILSNTEVVELLPPRTWNLQADGYDQYRVPPKPSRQGTEKPPAPRRLSPSNVLTLLQLVSATGQTADPLSQPHTNMPHMRKSGGRGKVSRRG